MVQDATLLLSLVPGQTCMGLSSAGMVGLADTVAVGPFFIAMLPVKRAPTTD